MCCVKVVGCAISPSGKLAATATHDHGIQIWELPSGRILQDLTVSPPPLLLSSIQIPWIRCLLSMDQMLAQYSFCWTAVGYCLLCLCCHSLHLGRPGAVSLVCFRGLS